MPGPWDSAGKRLLREMPQHIVRETLLNFVQRHFPELSTFAEVHVENIKDTDALQYLLNQLLFTVQTTEEAKQAIVDASKEAMEE